LREALEGVAHGGLDVGIVPFQHLQENQEWGHGTEGRGGVFSGTVLMHIEQQW